MGNQGNFPSSSQANKDSDYGIRGGNNTSEIAKTDGFPKSENTKFIPVCRF